METAGRLKLGDYVGTRGGYRVEHRPHGVAVFGCVPISELAALGRAWQRQGYDLIDSAISGKIGATLVICDREGGLEWRRELGIEIKAETGTKVSG